VSTVALALECIVGTLLDVDVGSIQYNGHLIYIAKEFPSYSTHMAFEIIPV
jgi:hypothetical protein